MDLSTAMASTWPLGFKAWLLPAASLLPSPSDLPSRARQIAGDLGIQERTVKTHRQSIMVKLKIRSVAALARLTQEAGVFTAEPPSSRAVLVNRQAC